MDHYTKRFYELRTIHGYTQEDVATYLGIHRTAYNKCETGRTYPSIDTIRALCRLYGVTADCLVGDEPLPENIGVTTSL